MYSNNSIANNTTINNTTNSCKVNLNFCSVNSNFPCKIGHYNNISTYIKYYYPILDRNKDVLEYLERIPLFELWINYFRSI